MSAWVANFPPEKVGTKVMLIIARHRELQNPERRLLLFLNKSHRFLLAAATTSSCPHTGLTYTPLTLKSTASFSPIRFCEFDFLESVPSLVTYMLHCVTFFVCLLAPMEVII